MHISWSVLYTYTDTLHPLIRDAGATALRQGLEALSAQRPGRWLPNLQAKP